VRILSVNDYRRLSRIIHVLARSGARPALLRLGLLRSNGSDDEDPDMAAEGFVAALEQLGPTFVKLGQIMATRSDLLPLEVTERLSRLHNNVAPVPYTEIQDQLSADLGGSPESVFSEFSPVPLAAASIAQVYAARLKTGEEVVVKVRRPGIEAVMQADLRLLLAAARIIERRTPWLRRHHPVRVVEELSQALLEEIDFRIEARNQEEIRGQSRQFLIPAVHLQYSTERVMVSTRIYGENPTAAFRERMPTLAKDLAPKAARGLLTMILMDGVFHADPHPGNVLVTPEGPLALLDFGSVGRLSARRREETLVVLGSLVDADAGAVSDVLLGWAGRTDAPPPDLELQVERFLTRYGAQSGQSIRLAEAINEFISIARNNDLTLPPDLILLLRTLGIAEGLARTLDPDLDVVAAIAPVVMRAFAARFGSKALAARGFRAFKELDQILTMAPEALRRGIGRLRREGLVFQAVTPDLAELPRAIERAGETLSWSIILAALILAAAITAIGSELSAVGLAFLCASGVVLVLFWLRLGRRG
jgi:ubiquinone biosynthesis protein